MTPASYEDDLQAAVLAMRADVLTSLTLGRVAIQTLEALCPNGEWMDEAAICAPLPQDETRLVAAIECALIDAATALGDVDFAA